MKQSRRPESVTVTDQAGNIRSGTSDAIGRLLKVTEFDDSSQYNSLYTYDVLGRLRKTAQTSGSTTQNRYFLYNDLGRLMRAKQVEQVANSNLNTTDPVTGNSSWSVGYSYDDNGNIATTTDALNRTITGTYETLNRLTLRDYSDSTADVSFTYDDVNIANSKGHLTKVDSSVSTTNYTAFDVLGRIKSSSQRTGTETYTMPDYSYDLSGAMVSQTYPSNRVVTTETDDLGRLSAVKSQLPNDVQKTMLSQLAYTSFGVVKQAKLGNGKWESAQFDSQRMQVTQIGLGSAAGDTSLLRINYEYGALNLGTGQVIAGTNNGNLAKQTIAVPTAPQGPAFTATQYYAYDGLNRLKTATENVTPQNQATQLSWRQQFNYDRFGNRRFDATNTTTLGSCPQAVCNPNIDLATNRLASSDGYSFDAEGNLTANPESQSFSYDAENHLVQIQNSSTQTSANYSYDGQGKRVKKTVGNQETYFVYDAFGKLVAEYTTNQAITQNGTQYLTTDALGSPRIATSATGQVASRHDYMPFGEEVAAGTGGRTTTQGYSQSDNARQKFTGYERDAESELDFAQARYYSSKHGRFTSIDPLAASASIKAPQSLNRYSYANNSPYKFTDSLGLSPQCQGPGGGQGSTLASCDGAGNNNQGPCPPTCGPTVMVPLSAPITAATAMIVETVEVLATPEAVDAVIQELEALAAASESRVLSTISPRALITLPTVGGAGLIILGTATTVEPNNCPSNVCPAGTGPARELSPQTEIQPTTTTTDPPSLDGNLTIVRGGESPLPPRGTVFSGAFGVNITDASGFVPHGQIRATTVRAIIESGGSAIPVPEMTRGGNLNMRHVNIVEGIKSTFSPLMPNPVPKANRIQ